MKTLLDTWVVTDGNRAAAEPVKNITKAQSEPLRLFIVGAPGTGKTTLLRGRATEKDLLSTRKVKYHAAMEMIGALQFDAPDSFFEELGGVDVLLVDDFLDFYEDAETGPMLCKLMLAERARLGLDTVLASTKHLAELDLAPFEGALDGFTEVEMAPLDADARQQFVRALCGAYAEEEVCPRFDDATVAYLANEFSDDLNDVRHAMQYLTTAAGFAAEDAIDVETVKQALAS